MKEQLTIEGTLFTLAAIQRPGVSAVYRSDNTFLRIGRHDQVARDLTSHEGMLRKGFPVPKILSRGQYEGWTYFIEESLGENHFGQLFASDVEQTGEIREIYFEQFLAVTRKFAEAQLKTIVETGSMESLAGGIRLPELCRELPNHASRLRERFSRVAARLKDFPSVVSHGDFNPHNLYPKGVIDFETTFVGPFGYDLITNLVHVSYFPASPDFEFLQEYVYTPSQRERYISMMDELCVNSGLPFLSPFLSDFEFCRAVWLAVNIEKYPKLQAFRYQLLQERFL